jgi:hypothetical protein
MLLSTLILGGLVFGPAKNPPLGFWAFFFYDDFPVCLRIFFVLAPAVHTLLVYHFLMKKPLSVSKPDIYEYLEGKGLLYAIRLPANNLLYDEIKHLLTRPIGRPSRNPVVRFHNFKYRAASWEKLRRVVAKVEWHSGDFFPRVGFIITNMSAGAEGLVRFHNGRGIAEQWIKGGKYDLNTEG